MIVCRQDLFLRTSCNQPSSVVRLWMRITFSDALLCSQPPLLSQMVKVVYEATNDTSFLADSFAALQIEHEFWTTAPVQVTVSAAGRAHRLSRYWSTLYTPRPESYR